MPEPDDGEGCGTGAQHESEDQYEVVISPDDGLGKEHAELMQKELIADGFHDHVVSVRSIDGEAEA